MKKLIFAIGVVTVLASCGGNTKTEEVSTTDSTAVVTDSTKCCADSTLVDTASVK